MAFEVEIDGTPVSHDVGAVFSELALTRSTFTFSVTSHDGSVQPELWQTVMVTEGSSTYRFVITSAPRAGSNGSNLEAITTEVTSSDPSVYAEGRVVKMTLPEATVADRLALLAALLSDVGVTVHPSQQPGGILPETPIDYEMLDEVLDKDAELAGGWVWEIDADLKIRMFDPALEPAAFNISIGDGNTFGDISVTPSAENYANRVFVRFSSAAQNAYALLECSGNFSDGVPVTVGSRTYRFQDVLTDTNGNVKTGATLLESLENLVAAITLGGGAGSVYAASTTANTSVSAYVRNATQILAGALAPGESGNSIACTTTGANAVWIHEGGGSVTQFAGGADESLANVATAENAVAVAALGFYRDLVVERPDLFSLPAAQAYAVAVVAATSQISDALVYQTLRTEPRAGQSQTIVAALRGVNGSYVLTKVDAVEGADGEVTRTVQATLGTRPGSTWHDDVKSWSGGGGSLVGLSVSGDGGGSGGGAAPGSLVWLAVSPSEFVDLEGTSTWRAATGRSGEGGMRVYLDPVTRGTKAATVRARLRSRSGSIKCRLFNLTANAPASAESTTVTSTSFQDVDLAATIASAGWYELQVAGTTDALGNALAYLE